MPSSSSSLSCCGESAAGGVIVLIGSAFAAAAAPRVVVLPADFVVALPVDSTSAFAAVLAVERVLVAAFVDRDVAGLDLVDVDFVDDLRTVLPRVVASLGPLRVAGLVVDLEREERAASAGLVIGDRQEEKDEQRAPGSRGVADGGS